MYVKHLRVQITGIEGLLIEGNMIFVVVAKWGWVTWVASQGGGYTTSQDGPLSRQEGDESESRNHKAIWGSQLTRVRNVSNNYEDGS